MSSLTVWARPGLPPRSLSNAVLWEAFLPDDAPSDWVSLPEYVHREREDLRTRYQSWLSGVSQRALNGVTLAESMSIRSNLSYWWMTLPTDNSLAADSPAYRVVRFFALSDVAADTEFDDVTIVSDRVEVAEAVANWARSNDKPVTIKAGKPIQHTSERRRPSRGPFLAMLRVFWNHLRIALHSRRQTGCRVNKQGVVIVDYLAHLKEAGLGRSFRSNYWGPLVEMLEEWPEPVNWLHISAKYATPAVVNKDLKRCKTFDVEDRCHSLLHSYVTLRVVGRAILDYVRIRNFGLALRKRPDVFTEVDTGLDPSHLLASLIEDQYFGRSAALNAVWINLWESVIDSIPKQRIALYLFENQPWELAFLSAWYRSDSGRPLAVAHSAMRFWDLRYFSIPDVDNASGKPSPTEIVVNGPLMKATAVEGGYKEELLLVAESLRMPLDISAQTGGAGDVLVLGEYDGAYDARLLSAAEAIINQLGSNVNAVYRPHPTSTEDLNFPSNRWSRSEFDSIATAIAQCEVAVCGQMTTAAMDACMNGRRVFIVAAADAFISSPAIGLPNVQVVTSQADLNSAPRVEPESLPSKSSRQLVCTDRKLPRWRSILNP